MPPQPYASIIVCTHNRADSLARCLASIAADPSATSAEVVVVDNASQDRTAEVIANAAGQSPRPLSGAWLADPGVSAARNCGIRQAAGQLLLFTDDDVQVQPGWIDALVEPFADSEIAAVGGRIVPTFLCDRPGWLTDDGIFTPLTLGDDGLSPFVFTETRLPLGANMAVRASLLGPEPFDVRLGPVGKLKFGYEEYFVLAPLARGHKVVYTPNAVVWHLLDEHRLTVENTRRIIFHLGFGSVRYQRLRGERAASLPRRLVRAVRAWRRLRKAASGEDRTVEMRAWLEAGSQTEWLLGGKTRWLANLIAARGLQWF